MRKYSRWLLGLLLAANGAGAADIVVTRLDDPTPAACLPTDCSLREAVIAANALPGADVIHLPSGIIQLTIANTSVNPGATQGDLDLTDAVEIVGVSAASTSIIAENNDRIFNLINNVNVTLRQMTLGGGQSGFGGAINLYDGTLTIEDAIIGNNFSTGVGGAIRSNSGYDVTLRRVQIINNTALGDGGAINLGSGGLVVIDSTISGNHAVNGGAIHGYGARIYRSLIQNNTASGNGGGIAGQAGCSCTSIEIHESTIAGNSAVQGGGVWASPPLDIELSTFSGNTASSVGGDVFATTTGGGSSANGFHIYSSTLYGNTAPGGGSVYFYNDTGGLGMPPDFQNTLISGVCSQSGGGMGTFYGLLGNIESPGNTCAFGIFSQNSVPAANLKLGTLGDNGGPTPTHLPLAGSALIDTGWHYVCTGLDQRGYARVDAGCDVGAVEASAIDDVLFRDGFDL
jgi:CSLREA domain-containing protein